MEFTLLDQGEPPDLARICGEPMDDCPLSGRGTHLIKAIMDEVSYEKVSTGNQLKLIKRLPVSRTDDGSNPGLWECGIEHIECSNVRKRL